jgi:hypothetical protein
MRKFNADYYARHRSKVAMRRVEVVYGVTSARYAQLLAEQDGCCAICSTEKVPRCGRFYVDHDHATGAARGLLCHKCNTGIGMFRDDPAVMRAAIEYIERRSPTAAA